MDTYSNEKYTNTNEIGGDMHHTKIKSYDPKKNCNQRWLSRKKNNVARSLSKGRLW